MEYLLPLLFITVIFSFFAVTARAWQRRHTYLEEFWHQFGNSVFLAAMVTLLVLVIGTLTSFSVGRMRIRNG